MKELSVGIIGCGKISQVRHIPEYLANPYVRVAGCFDLAKTRAESVAASSGGTAYDSWQDLVASPDIDAVSVCTANASHAEIAVAALEAGKDVLLEKPMATTMQDCQLIADTARATGRLLMLDHNQRFNKAHQLARDLYQSGAIGELIGFRTTFGHGGPEVWSVDPGPGTWFFDPAKTTLGVVGDLGVHKTDLLHFLSGERVVEVEAKLATLEKVDASGTPIPLDDNAIAIYTLSNGAVGTMTASWCFHGEEDNSTVLYGRQGMIAIYVDPEHQVVVTKPDAQPQRYDVEPIQTNDNQTASGVIDAFVDAIRLGLPSPVPADEALATMRAVFACQQSSRIGGAVQVPENKRS
ncbi:MAG: Gfo/Idh/MocA family oxidoreductase [Propionibacteriaceae bacterium]|nr:Gfo/Idh/MocA family oxidoreductase [Propionibacteriaceae bacterium]